MEPLKKLFERDFREAIACLIPAYVGLVNIYGYDENPLPNPYAEQLPFNYKDQILPSVGSTQFFDDCLIWIRDAIRWMVQFQQTEQNYVLPLSIKALVGNQQSWDQGLKLGKWRFEIPNNFTFSPPQDIQGDDREVEDSFNTDFFGGQRHVRLRGISAFIETNNSSDVFRLFVKIPSASICKHISENTRVLDQTKVPPCYIARTANRSNVREPDIVGISALHNVSPFGVWELRLSKLTISGTPIEEIRDVQIDLHIAMRSLI